MQNRKIGFQNFLNQLSRKMCQLEKWGSIIIFIKFQLFKNILKTGLPPWFYRKHFYYKNYLFQFHVFL